MSKVIIMKHLIYTLSFLVALLIIQSCDLDPTEPTSNCQSGLCLDVEINVGNEDFERGRTYTAPNDVEYHLDLINFYFSRLTLVGDNGPEAAVDSFSFFTTDVDNLSGNNAVERRVYNLPATGTYNKIRMGVGLYADINATDPATVPIDHPLHPNQGTYWNWATAYRFVQFEGSADSAGVEKSILFHAGLDTFFHEIELPITAFNAAEVDGKEANLTIDLNEVFGAAGNEIDLASERRIHGGPPTYELSDKFLQNFANAIRITD